MSDRRQRREVMRSRARRYRKARSFRHVRTPFDPLTGKFFGLIPQETAAGSPLSPSSYAVQELMILGEYDNYVKCVLTIDGTESFVAKPYILRRLTYDGQTISSVSYTYDGVGQRIAVGSVGGEAWWERQYIIPEYYEGEFILAVPADLILGSGVVCEWQDINTAGRCWATDETGVGDP